MQSTAAVPACEEKTRLVRMYSFATSDYNRAVLVMHERVGIMSRRQYERIRTYAEKTRVAAEEARVALERHTAEHGC